MKLFITGISGLLGLNAALQARGRWEVSGCYLSHTVRIKGVDAFRLDATSYEELGAALERIRPDVILHTAGLTNVDRCEEDPERAYRLNVGTTENVSRLALALGASLIHISTDHLFDGTRRLLNEDAPPSPLNAYGQTKWEAERAVERHGPAALIVRTNFYGWGTPHKRSLSDWILEGLAERHELTMFSDVFFTPILVNDLIDIAFDLVEARGTGVYNVTGGERVSKEAFGRRVARVFGYAEHGIRPIGVDEAGLKAPRPKDMSLSSEKVVGFLGRKMPGVEEGLVRMKTLRERGWPRAMELAARSGAGETVVDGPEPRGR